MCKWAGEYLSLLHSISEQEVGIALSNIGGAIPDDMR